MLRFLSGGESHGPALVAMLDGMPAGLPIDIEAVNLELWRRQQGYGRGNRQKIEQDRAQFVGGVRHGITTGAPIAIMIQNRDFENWRHVMSATPLAATTPEALEQIEKKRIERFRPGHADLAGTIKYRQRDIRDVLERASARETAARVAVGAVCKQLLNRFGIEVISHVVQVGAIKAPPTSMTLLSEYIEAQAMKSELFCMDAATTERMKEAIKVAWQEGNSLGGVVEVIADGLPVGLGSYTQWDRRLDGQLAQAITSIQAMKAVELGDGFSASGRPGSEVHDAIYPRQHREDPLPFRRLTNNAGGLEGGMTNGERLWLRAYMKPIPTMRQGLESVNFPDFKADRAHYERSDVCAIAAASVVCKAMVCLVLANAFVDKFAGDSIADMEAAVRNYEKYCLNPAAQIEHEKVSPTQATVQSDAEPQGNEDAVGEF
ncbi:MAG TPA: chorismate synthase [Planktothrix sp.]|jgi:chorismate synthase